MTEEEKSGIVHEVIETIKGQSQDIAELPVSDNIEDFTTLPAVGRDGRLKKFRVTDLRSEFAGGSNIELVQELGEAADKPISQKAVSAVIAEIEKKARDNAEAIASMSASGGVPIAQEAGDSATSVMSQKAVTEEISPLREKTPIETVGDGFFVSDKFGNIIMKIDSNGFDVAKLSARFLSLLASSVNIPIFETKEIGFYVTDANLNIGFQVNSEHNNYLQFKY